ncbi:hypothetical protein FOPG_13922 [Fusarium oxysporum f. sp. conglutinans race 2 54008]|uniref:Uncharacterized protein n=1 Tax=Fusarium oxysporum f. sp. conglutinans race 2 54008 TaxID=1089457 RepID=X0IAI2_FUSOX|nr:hypothetical protein FOPG_13922 [Fusarium oxysporum f. sp. conglutinans race 2 54008]
MTGPGKKHTCQFCDDGFDANRRIQARWYSRHPSINLPGMRRSSSRQAAGKTTHSVSGQPPHRYCLIDEGPRDTWVPQHAPWMGSLRARPFTMAVANPGPGQRRYIHKPSYVSRGTLLSRGMGPGFWAVRRRFRCGVFLC